MTALWVIVIALVGGGMVPQLDRPFDNAAQCTTYLTAFTTQLKPEDIEHIQVLSCFRTTQEEIDNIKAKQKETK